MFNLSIESRAVFPGITCQNEKYKKNPPTLLHTTKFHHCRFQKNFPRTPKAREKRREMRGRGRGGYNSWFCSPVSVHFYIPVVLLYCWPIWIGLFLLPSLLLARHILSWPQIYTLALDLSSHLMRPQGNRRCLVVSVCMCVCDVRCVCVCGVFVRVVYAHIPASHHA